MEDICKRRAIVDMSDPDINDIDSDSDDSDVGYSGGDHLFNGSRFKGNMLAAPQVNLASSYTNPILVGGLGAGFGKKRGKNTFFLILNLTLI